MSFSKSRKNTIRAALLDWGKANQRQYPWRDTQDPYAILVAEVLLHRTRADQVLPVYIKLLKEYPTIQQLSRAHSKKLSDILRPLGLFWRVPLLKKMANIIALNGGKIPPDVSWLQSLPGVGSYIAASTVSCAFNHPEPILDTNTVRILGRLTGSQVTDSSRRSRKFRKMMSELIDPEQPRAFNLALLDLAALICKPAQPECPNCPLQKSCLYGKNLGSQTDLLSKRNINDEQ